MKVCHMSSAHGQEDTRIFHKECVSLSQAGFKVYLITRGKTYPKNNVHIIGVEDAGQGRLGRMLFTTDAIYEKALEIDAEIYHAHDPELLPVLLKLKRAGKKTIFDSHEHVVGTIEEKDYIPATMRWIVKNVYESYQAFVCRKMDAVITATPNVADYFLSLGCHRVVDLCNFPILHQEFVAPCYESKKMVFAGGIEEQWNHENIIRAIERLEDVQYILCGTGNKDYFDKLQRLPGWNKVEYKGRLSFEHVPDVLRSASVGLSLLTPGANTDWENGNMANTKIFEEMMAGLPVICTDFKRWKDFVEEYDCGICVDPQDVSQIAQAVAMLINDSQMAKIKGLNGRRAVEEKFNWAAEEKKLIALYKEIGGAIVND